eukprot:SAG11_NODE_804_length_7096_cov_14.131056_4_plen_87_part_00
MLSFTLKHLEPVVKDLLSMSLEFRLNVLPLGTVDLSRVREHLTEQKQGLSRNRDEHTESGLPCRRLFRNVTGLVSPTSVSRVDAQS